MKWIAINIYLCPAMSDQLQRWSDILLTTLKNYNEHWHTIHCHLISLWRLKTQHEAIHGIASNFLIHLCMYSITTEGNLFVPWVLWLPPAFYSGLISASSFVIGNWRKVRWRSVPATGGSHITTSTESIWASLNRCGRVSRYMYRRLLARIIIIFVINIS